MAEFARPYRTTATGRVLSWTVSLGTLAAGVGLLAAAWRFGSWTVAGFGVTVLVTGLSVTSYTVAETRAWVRGTLGPRPRQWLRAKLGRGLGVDELARRCGVPADSLRAHAPTYTERLVPKRSGGTRRLLVPDPATKALQRTLLRRVFAALKAHPAACGFERGKGIVDHAAPHVGRAVVVTCDIKDFFPSVPARRVERYFRRVGWDADAARLLTRLTTYEGGLPQGAPTSPRLSNVVLYDLDVKLTALAERRGFRYTRYADDLAFSRAKDHPRRVRGLAQSVGRLLKANGFRLHPGKTRILRRHQRQTVCGLVVNDRLNLPRKTRRELRAALHRRRTGREATYTDEQLAGWAGVLAMVARGPR